MGFEVTASWVVLEYPLSHIYNDYINLLLLF